jgi:transketolase
MTYNDRMTRDLHAIATRLRKDIVRMHRTGSNVASAMSAADIIAVLYFDVMNVAAPDDPARDRFILSKGHAASALYAALARKGFLDPAELDRYCADGSPLTGHPTEGRVPGVEVSVGSLGHGLPIAAGIAWVARLDTAGYRVFTLLGDGELQEGSCWEGAMVASRLGLDNLVAVVDANGLQGYGRVADIQPIETFAAKLAAFGWGVREVDGHDLAELHEALSDVPIESGHPSAVIARTVKGKGIAEMEDDLGWHYYNVPPEKLQAFLEELDRGT